MPLCLSLSTDVLAASSTIIRLLFDQDTLVSLGPERFPCGLHHRPHRKLAMRGLRESLRLLVRSSSMMAAAPAAGAGTMPAAAAAAAAAAGAAAAAASGVAAEVAALRRWLHSSSSSSMSRCSGGVSSSSSSNSQARHRAALHDLLRRRLSSGGQQQQRPRGAKDLYAATNKRITDQGWYIVSRGAGIEVGGEGRGSEAYRCPVIVVIDTPPLLSRTLTPAHPHPLCCRWQPRWPWWG